MIVGWMKGWLLMIGFCLTAGLSSHAQEVNLINGSFNNIPFSEWIRQLESQTSYRFYYKAEETDSIKINLKVTHQPLSTVLKQVFKGKEFNYSVDRNNNVFIIYGWTIQTDFALNFSSYRSDSALRKKDLIVDSFADQGSKGEDKIYSIGIKSNAIRHGNAIISGRVLQNKTGEPVIGASVFIKDPTMGVSTDPLGYYSISMPRGRHILYFSSVGMREVKRSIILYSDGKLNTELDESVQSLKEVVVTRDHDLNLARTEMGIEKLDIKSIRQIPTALGEADVIRALLTLPGVSSVGEASAGFNVRGGGADQNLILLNDAVVYNPSHLFGFFPSFNPDIIKDVELYKSSIPAKFGGRLASILDIHTREGNKKKFVVSGGIGPVAGRFNVEGPIVEGKTSFILSGRANYSDWLLKLLQNDAYKNSSASFYDVNLGVSHQINEKNNLFFNAYYSDDKFRFKYDTTYNYKNYNASLKWTHIYGDKLYSNLSATYSKYAYSVESNRNPITAYILDYSIEQAQLKADFNYFYSAAHSFDFGISALHYNLQPGTYLPDSPQSLVAPDYLEKEQALESAIYFSDKFIVTPTITVDVGLRYSVFNFLGPKTVAQYQEGQSKSEFTRIGAISYGSGKVINTYQGPEFRVAARKTLSENSSVKVSFNSGRQYLHLLSNTAAISPTDIWKLSDPNIKPQLGQQFSAGYYKNFFNGLLETSIEIYYKMSKNYLDYKSGATLIMNHNLETDVIGAKGKSYGIEFMIRKTRGKLNGWLSYTYSRSFLRVDDPSQTETINNGNWYSSNYDKPNNFNLVGNYKFNHRFNVSINFTYTTGRPITLPIAEYSYEGSYRVYYSNRNEYRIPDYIRTDVAMNIEGNHKIKKLAHSSWTIAVYNLLGRKNPYSVYFNSVNGNIEGYKLSILGQPIPTVTYNFRF